MPPAPALDRSVPGLSLTDGRTPASDHCRTRALEESPRHLYEYERRESDPGRQQPGQRSGPDTSKNAGEERLSDPCQAIASSAALRALSPQDRQRVLRIASMLKPEESRDLQRLLEQRGPEGAASLLLSRDSRGRTMLDNLSDMAEAGELRTRNLAERRSVLLGSTVQILANPHNINQADKATCGATALNWMFVAVCNDPAEVSRLIRGLAIDGQVQLRGVRTERGHVSSILTFVPGSDIPDQERGRGAPRRKLADRLLQAAIMQRGAADQGLIYDPARDANFRPGTDAQVSRGLDCIAIVRLLSTFSGSRLLALAPAPNSGIKGRETVLAGIEEQVRQKGGALAILEWGRGTHAVAVTKIDRARGTVHFRNPQGQDQFMPLGQFTQRLAMGVVGKAIAPEAPPPQQLSRREPPVRRF